MDDLEPRLNRRFKHFFQGKGRIKKGGMEAAMVYKEWDKDEPNPTRLPQLIGILAAGGYANLSLR